MKPTTLKTNTILILTISSALLTPTISYADFGISANIEEEHSRYRDKGDDDIDLLLGLGIEYRGEKFNMDRTGISYDFSKSDKVALEAFATSKNHELKASDNKTFSGMKERETSLDLGGRAIVKTGIGPVVVEATKDVNSSKGYQAEVKLGGIAPHSSHWNGKREITIAPTVGLRYQSADVVDYYYGVRNSEATASRSAYKAKAATTPFLGLEAQANITEHFSINGGLGYELRSNSVKNSPLTDTDDHDLTANIGFTYWF